ncbi:MAG TPA: hypothetical protein VK287_05315 [Gaiellaceae bacterium]|nr:hypothetical protein [Gaiellaceae bacterium]
MNLGLRAILLAVAILLFVIAVFSDSSYADLLAWGLAATAAALLVEELGLGTRINMGGPAATHSLTAFAAGATVEWLR